MFLEETVKLFNLIKNVTYEAKWVYPYTSEYNNRKLELFSTGRTHDVKLKVYYPTQQQNTPRPPSQPGTITISNSGSFYTHNIKPIGYVINIKTSDDRTDLLMVEWIELQNDILIANNGSGREGKQVMSALFFSNGSVLINGELYEKNDPRAFNEDLIGEYQFSVLEIMRFAEIFENVK